MCAFPSVEAAVNFEERANQETEDFNASRAGQEPWVYMQADLVRALAGLTNAGS